MKNLMIALILGLSLSVNAQSQMSKPTNNKIVGDQNNTQVVTPQSSNGSTTSPVVNNPTPVVVTPSSNDRGFDEDRRYDYDYRRNSYNTHNDVYRGTYEPPTRNEMRYRQGQQCFTEFEINTRPFSLLNGFYGAGLELSTSCKSSFLFDFSSGTSTLFDLQATSGMVGFRLYSKTGMVGRYASVRGRLRSYEQGDYYGGNLSLMGGYKANWDGVTLSGEFGLGYQGADGIYITLPTWAITLGYRL
jgi:hypothetical protein